MKQFNISAKGTIDAINMLAKKIQVAFKNKVEPNAFVNKEKWNVIQMKEEYHAKFITILQIIYQRKG